MLFQFSFLCGLDYVFVCFFEVFYDFYDAFGCVGGLEGYVLE